jgi:hypothetical protein
MVLNQHIRRKKEEKQIVMSSCLLLIVPLCPVTSVAGARCHSKITAESEKGIWEYGYFRTAGLSVKLIWTNSSKPKTHIAIIRLYRKPGPKSTTKATTWTHDHLFVTFSMFRGPHSCCACSIEFPIHVSMKAHFQGTYHVQAIVAMLQ